MPCGRAGGPRARAPITSVSVNPDTRLADFGKSAGARGRSVSASRRRGRATAPSAANCGAGHRATSTARARTIPWTRSTARSALAARIVAYRVAHCEPFRSVDELTRSAASGSARPEAPTAAHRAMSDRCIGGRARRTAAPWLWPSAFALPALASVGSPAARSSCSRVLALVHTAGRLATVGAVIAIACAPCSVGLVGARLADRAADPLRRRPTARRARPPLRSRGSRGRGFGQPGGRTAATATVELRTRGAPATGRSSRSAASPGALIPPSTAGFNRRIGWPTRACTRRSRRDRSCASAAVAASRAYSIAHAARRAAAGGDDQSSRIATGVALGGTAALTAARSPRSAPRDSRTCWPSRVATWCCS